MNDEYLKLAVEKIADKDILVNLASRRAKELARGSHPVVAIDRKDRGNYLDIALREIGEGKITYEFDKEDDSE